MSETNPATPATPAATPGSNAQGAPASSAGTQPAANPGNGGQSEGTVTISTKEYARLQRSDARQQSFERRAQFQRNQNPSPQPTNGDPNDPVAQEVLREQALREESDRRAFKAEMTLKVRDLLEKEEFKALPVSTRALILRNPGALSDANNIDEALLDIEDFVRENMGDQIPVNTGQHNNGGAGGSRNPGPSGHETPPVINSGTPAPTTAVQLEDVSHLHGPARSRAVLRNALKSQARGVR